MRVSFVRAKKKMKEINDKYNGDELYKYSGILDWMSSFIKLG